MHNIFKKWRTISRLHEKVNYLESNKRFINDQLVPIDNDRHNIPITEEEITKIKKVAQLEGDPNFLGSGTKGQAYKFSNKVLKFTNDAQEAMACELIRGKNHPNVYDIYYVAKRNKDDIKKAKIKEKYIIVYKFLDYPTRAMLIAAKSLHGRITMGKNVNFFYNWSDNTYDNAKNLLANLSALYAKDAKIVGDLPETDVGFMPRKKLEEMCKFAGYNPIETRTVTFFFGGPFSPPSYEDFKSPSNFKNYVKKNESNIYRDYLNQLCLGLTFLKENNIDYYDIKGTNIMQKNNQICIIDIGYSTVREFPEIPNL
jgi:serine/threonine protein kinase